MQGHRVSPMKTGPEPRSQRPRSGVRGRLKVLPPGLNWRGTQKIAFNS